MLRLALKGALARRLRLALTAASIVIGVGFVSGTLVLTDTLNTTFDQIFGNASKGVSVVVRGQQAFQGSTDSGPTDERALVPCPHCKAEIDEEAEQCPRCGMFLSREDAPPQAKSAVWIVLMVLALLAALAMVFA